GFTWFFGLVIDRQDGDVILLGMKDPERPRLDLDCLVTAMRAAYEGKAPSCSLDPHPDKRFQMSVVKGVPWNTRWATVMIGADYDMKKICHAQIAAAPSGLHSWFDLSVRESQRRPTTGRTSNRWWFNRPKQDIARTLFPDRDTTDLVILYRNPVIVMT